MTDRKVGAVLYTVEQTEEGQPWAVYEVTVLPDAKGSTRRGHARVQNTGDASDVWDAPYDNLDATRKESEDRCLESNGGTDSQSAPI